MSHFVMASNLSRHDLYIPVILKARALIYHVHKHRPIRTRWEIIPANQNVRFFCTAEHSINLRSVVDLKSSPSAGLAKHIPHLVAKIPYTEIRPTLERNI